MRVYQMLQSFVKEEGPEGAWVLAFADGSPAGIFMAGPDSRFDGEIWTLDLFVHPAFEQDAHLLVEWFEPQEACTRRPTAELRT